MHLQEVPREVRFIDTGKQNDGGCQGLGEGDGELLFMDMDLQFGKMETALWMEDNGDHTKYECT